MPLSYTAKGQIVLAYMETARSLTLTPPDICSSRYWCTLVSLLNG
jgi:hypothetical protein